MPTLGVCGDSFMSATMNTKREETWDSEGRHFTEILAKKIGYDYFTLARAACSNNAIRLQVDEMIKQKVDLVIIGTTTSNRLEIPHLGRKYNPHLGVYNLDYRKEFYPDRSATNPKFKHNLISETLTNIFYDPVPMVKKIVCKHQKTYTPELSEEQFTALEQYYDFLYDPEYKAQLDKFIILSAIKSLETSKIPFVIIWHGYSVGDPDFSDLTFHDHRIITQGPLCPQNWESVSTPGKRLRRWHTDDLAQEKGAELWYNYLIEHGYLKY